jgi:hypothetical protein
MKKVIAAFSGLGLLGVAAMLMGPTGGYPVNPTFQTVTINTSGQALNLVNTGGTFSGGTAQAYLGFTDSVAREVYIGFGGVANELDINNALSSGTICLFTNSLCRFTVQSTGGITVGAPTGGDQGVGSINATGVYSGGTRLLPTIVCTTTCSASGLLVGQTLIIQKASSTSRNTTVAIAADGDLILTTLPTGSYTITGAVTFTAGAGGFKYEIGPSSCSGSNNGGVVGSAQTATTVTQNVAINTQLFAGTGDTAVFSGASALSNQIAVCWAQDASNAANSTLLGGGQSYLQVTRTS